MAGTKKPGVAGQREGAMRQVSEAQETETSIRMAEAGLRVYCAFQFRFSPLMQNKEMHLASAG